MRFIGDIHGTVHKKLYDKAIEGCDKSIQVGDLGLGFSDGDVKGMFKGVDTSKHFFIRGNHDNPEVCEEQVNHIDSGQSDDHGIFFVNGGWSIDGPDCPWDCGRTPNKNWWDNEEHDEACLEDLIQEYEKCKPQIVVTHEAPWTITNLMFNPQPRWISRTADTLQKMLNIHQPELWIFGHWHIRKDIVSNGTRFICLEEGGIVDIDI